MDLDNLIKSAVKLTNKNKTSGSYEFNNTAAAGSHDNKILLAHVPGCQNINYLEVPINSSIMNQPKQEMGHFPPQWLPTDPIWSRLWLLQAEPKEKEERNSPATEYKCPLL